MIAILLIELSPAYSLITRQSKFDANLKFTVPWKCRDPTPEEAARMHDVGNPTYSVSSSFDPVGTSNGCMPDATCIDGSSSWTNVFGCGSTATLNFSIYRRDQ